MAHLSVKHFSPLRKSFSPSRRHCRHFASRFLAIFVCYLFILCRGARAEYPLVPICYLFIPVGVREGVSPRTSRCPFLDAPLLRRTAAVVRHRCHVRYLGDL